jgi:hypothetical protein
MTEEAVIPKLEDLDRLLSGKGTQGNVVALYYNRKRAGMALLAIIPVAAACIWLITLPFSDINPSDYTTTLWGQIVLSPPVLWFGAIVATFFIMLLPWEARHAFHAFFSKKPAALLLPEGVWFDLITQGILPWQKITKIRLSKTQGYDLLRMEVLDKRKNLKRGFIFRTSIYTLSNNIPFRPDEILEFIEKNGLSEKLDAAKGEGKS